MHNFFMHECKTQQCSMSTVVCQVCAKENKTQTKDLHTVLIEKIVIVLWAGIHFAEIFYVS